MYRFFYQQSYPLSALALALFVTLAGCTDAMVGPEAEAAQEPPTLERTAPLLDAPSEGLETPGVQGRVAQRHYIIFPPDSTVAPPPGSGTIPFSGRFDDRYDPVPDTSGLSRSAEALPAGH